MSIVRLLDASTIEYMSLKVISFIIDFFNVAVITNKLLTTRTQVLFPGSAFEMVIKMVRWISLSTLTERPHKHKHV